MPNNYFSFKQFTIYQDQCAMKVCTDACLFGAWTARMISKYNPEVQSILDIGTGTGLLSLMLAQQLDASIDAIEIDAPAAIQAKGNIRASPWKNIRVYNIPVQEYDAVSKYDLIVSNPPFYESSLLSPDENRNAAMHDRYLTLDELIQSIRRLLATAGYASVLLPYARASTFTQLLAQYDLYIVDGMNVKQSVNHEFFRTMFFISSHKGNTNLSEMSIYAESRQYTTEFKELLSEYYQKL